MGAGRTKPKKTAKRPPARRGGRVSAAEVDPSTGLTANLEAFCQALAQNKPSAEAYAIAFPNTRSQAQTRSRRIRELMADGKINARVAALREAVTAVVVERIGVDEARLLEEIAAIAFSDVGDLFETKVYPSIKEGAPPESRIKLVALEDIKALPKHVRASISNLEIERRVRPMGDGVVDEYDLIKIKFWNKNDALEKLARNLGFYREDNAQKQGVFAGMPPEVVLAVRQWLAELRKRYSHGSARAIAGNAAPAGGSPRPS